MKVFIQFLTAFTGCIGFSIVFHVRRSEWLRASLGGVFSWAVYLIALHFLTNDYIAAFLGASASALYGEVAARKAHAPATIFISIAFVPLIPGASLYRTADALMNNLVVEGFQRGTYTLYFAASMSAGIVVTTLVTRKMISLLHSEKDSGKQK